MRREIVSTAKREREVRATIRRHAWHDFDGHLDARNRGVAVQCYCVSMLDGMIAFGPDRNPSPAKALP